MHRTLGLWKKITLLLQHQRKCAHSFSLYYFFFFSDTRSIYQTSCGKQSERFQDQNIIWLYGQSSSVLRKKKSNFNPIMTKLLNFNLIPWDCNTCELKYLVQFIFTLSSQILLVEILKVVKMKIWNFSVWAQKSDWAVIVRKENMIALERCVEIIHSFHNNAASCANWHNAPWGVTSQGAPNIAFYRPKLN